MYKKIKQQHELSLGMNISDDEIDADVEDEEYKKYQKIFFYYPTDNFETLKKIHDNKDYLNQIGDSIYYIRDKESHRKQFEKEWDEKYRQDWIKDTTFSFDTENDPEEKREFERAFVIWYNQKLSIKFYELWIHKFEKEWKQQYKHEDSLLAKKHRTDLSHLKESFNILFKG